MLLTSVPSLPVFINGILTGVIKGCGRANTTVHFVKRTWQQGFPKVDINGEEEKVYLQILLTLQPWMAGASVLPRKQGRLSEWLGIGLQNRLRRFESATDLNKIPLSEAKGGFLFTDRRSLAKRRTGNKKPADRSELNLH